MNTLIDDLYQRIQHLTNRLELLKQKIDSFSPILNDDENLSSTVATLQQNVADLKIKINKKAITINVVAFLFLKL